MRQAKLVFKTTSRSTILRDVIKSNRTDHHLPFTVGPLSLTKHLCSVLRRPPPCFLCGFGLLFSIPLSVSLHTSVDCSCQREESGVWVCSIFQGLIIGHMLTTWIGGSVSSTVVGMYRRRWQPCGAWWLVFDFVRISTGLRWWWWAGCWELSQVWELGLLDLRMGSVEIGSMCTNLAVDGYGIGGGDVVAWEKCALMMTEFGTVCLSRYSLSGCWTRKRHINWQFGLRRTG